MQDLPVPHKLTLTDRKHLTVTGVTQVGRYDENTVILSTSMGVLHIDGQELELKSLSLESGQATVEGTVFALSYQQTGPDMGFWQRLFR